MAKLQQDAEALTLRAESAAAAEKSAIEALRDAHQALQEGAMPLLRLSQDITTRNHELDALRVTLKTSDAGSSVADIDMRLAELESQRTQLQRERERAASTLSLLRDEVSTLRTQLHRTQEDILRLSAASEKRASLEAQQAELLAAKDSMAKAVVEGKRAVAPLEHRRLELTRKRDEIRRRARDEEGELEATLRALQMQETQLEARERALEGYVSRGVAAALTTAETNLKKLRAKQEEEEKKCRDLLAEIANLKATERDTATLARQVAELLAYRRSKAEEEALGLELDEKGASLAAIGDRAALQQECRSLEAKERDLRSEADRARGALATVQVTAEDAARQLDAKEYKDIDGKYRRQLIELRTTEMASNDLDIYHKALERALLTFHTSKMADINKIVKELWQKTYRNSDIDYIQLKADVEGGTAARSYNYRMVMVVGGTELDMRGRCSAGQRVLACLVIRLALAETFCLNCGILALDEPTTNLDSENAASLAEALKALMLARRDQENFQLVVITHDEAFARLLGTREHAECMWRVVKDENQHSTVIKEDIAE